MEMLNSSALLKSFFTSSQPTLQGKAQALGSKPGFSTGVPGENLFARLLAGKNPDSGSAGTHFVKPRLSIGNESSATAVRSGATDGDSPVVAVLESAFLNHGFFPDTIVLSQEDFDFLGNILNGMGFSRAELTTLFRSMKQARSDGQITLTHFLKDLSAFEQGKLQPARPPFSLLTSSFDKSAVPHLELILRNLGIPADKMNALLAAASRENGAIDIKKLVFQLKSHAASMGKSAGTTRMADPAVLQTVHLKQGLDSVPGNSETKAPSQRIVAGDTEAIKYSNGPQPDSQTFQRMPPGLEKLGLSVSDKEAHPSFTLETFIQALEKKVQGPALFSNRVSMDPARLAEVVVEMPAVKSMKMEKAVTFFAFAEEMMIDRLNKRSRKGLTVPTDGFQNPTFPIGTGNSFLIAEHGDNDHGLSIAASLESTLLNHGVFPDKWMLSQEDIYVLGNVLEDLGLPRSELSAFFRSMEKNRSDGQIPLALFLKNLSVFEQAEIKESGLPSSFLTDSSDKSAIPYLELILRDLGVPSDKMDAMLAAASREGGAIDIEKLVFQLKSHIAEMEKTSGTTRGADAAATQTGHLKQGLNSVPGSLGSQAIKNGLSPETPKG